MCFPAGPRHEQNGRGVLSSRSVERALQVVYQRGAHLLEGRLEVVYLGRVRVRVGVGVGVGVRVRVRVRARARARARVRVRVR